MQGYAGWEGTDITGRVNGGKESNKIAHEFLIIEVGKAGRWIQAGSLYYSTIIKVRNFPVKRNIHKFTVKSIKNLPSQHCC